MPNFWIVGGPNGSGKTTFANEFLAPKMEVISPDSISYNQYVNNVQAGRLAIKRQEELLYSMTDFAIDTTFSGNREISLLKLAIELGYNVHLVFICLDNTDLCRERINNRVKLGGHDVPQEDVVRRFQRSIDNLLKSYHIPQEVNVFDNSNSERKLILSISNNNILFSDDNINDWAIPLFKNLKIKF